LSAQNTQLSLKIYIGVEPKQSSLKIYTGFEHKQTQDILIIQYEKSASIMFIINVQNPGWT